MNYILLMRPFNIIFVLISVFYGAIYQKGITFSLPLLFAMLSAACIAGAGYAVNDVFDFAIDKINKPNRVLPSEKIPLKSAYLFALFLFIIGITFSFFTGKIWNIGIAILNSFLLFFYARMFKMKLLSGNVIVSYTAASTFLYGGITNENIKPSLVIAVFAFLYTFIREIVKDMEDKAADEFYKATTLPVRIGFDKTIRILFLPALALFLYSIWIYALDKITFTALLLLILVINIPLIGMILYLKKKPLESAFKRISTYMKLDMLALLLILAIG